MDYLILMEKWKRYQQIEALVPQETAESLERAFEITYTHNSTAIEGNTLTLIETKLVLEDGISVGGKELREIYEQVNHQAAFRYVKQCIAGKQPLTEDIVKDIHQILMEHIMAGGIYRDVSVYISGAQHTPPGPVEMYRQVKDFYLDLNWKRDSLNPIELAAWTHAEFVRIHPFRDSNVIKILPEIVRNQPGMADFLCFISEIILKYIIQKLALDILPLKSYHPIKG